MDMQDVLGKLTKKAPGCGGEIAKVREILCNSRIRLTALENDNKRLVEDLEEVRILLSKSQDERILQRKMIAGLRASEERLEGMLSKMRAELTLQKTTTKSDRDWQLWTG
jgi:hypothetical protein